MSVTPPARPLADAAVRSVAIVRLRVGLGDLLASLPALRALRAARPDVAVTMITWPEVAPVLQRQAAYVDELLPFPGHVGIPERPARPNRWAAFIAAARDRGFDLAVQMYGGQAAANVVTAAVPARRHGGFFSPGEVSVDLSTHLPYPDRRPEVDRHLDLIRFLGVDGGDAALEFPIHDGDRHEALVLQERHHLPPHRYVIIHPGATAATRRWLPERFAAVADALVSRGHPVVVTGVRGEEGVVASVIAAMAHPAVDLCGQTSLGGMAALLSGCALLVGNDTGTAHLAAALAVPSITIFQAGDRNRWAAKDHTLHRAVEAGVGCQPCPHQSCPIDLRCATGVGVADVLAPATELLGQARS